MARFNGPEGIAVDRQGIIYIADTKNNAIRMISINNVITTLAGKGPTGAGYADGPCSGASFNQPVSLDVRTSYTTNGQVLKTTLVIADTGNHRVRILTYFPLNQTCIVSCLAGLCGNSTLSAILTQTRASPQSGYADGDGTQARFAAPRGVVFIRDDIDDVLVTDTDNYLIRHVYSNGTTYTLAGSVVSGETDATGAPVPGCTPPCLRGEQGYRDGNLTFAQFFVPVGIARGVNGSYFITDQNRIRILEMPAVVTNIYGVSSRGRVSTLAGDTLQGREDGFEAEARFFEPTGIFTTADNIAYIVDSTTCHIRRVSPVAQVAEVVACTTTATELVRPSGCTSFDPPVDKIGRKISRVEANILYNYGTSFGQNYDQGKYIKSCLGTPPPDRLDKHPSTNITYNGDSLVVDDGLTSVNEDNEAGMTVLVKCSSTCISIIGGGGSGVSSVYGTQWYSESSSICSAALHAGVLNSTMSIDEGYILVTYQRRDYIPYTPSNQYIHTGSTGYNNILSSDAVATDARIFSVKYIKPSRSLVHTIAGAPSAPLESAFGYSDGQPSVLSRFNSPHGIAAPYHTSASNTSFLYIADTNNHIIRAISATCTQICENGATCIGPDTCACRPGWTGVDCTTPICTSPCGSNKVCTGPDQCTCKPGYNGLSCTTPLCQQTCLNGGICAYPDTCSCPQGWFDTNCSTPVCSQTCGNGGSCNSPNTCTCQSEWSGNDCRTPVCSQTCRNGGVCIAPNTCMCPPQWSGYDCGQPVCTQGYFAANTPTHAIPAYRPCDLKAWCAVTHDFECVQQALKSTVLTVPYGPGNSKITGFTTSTNGSCFYIELPLDYRTPLSTVYADNTVSPYQRYSNFTPYTSNPSNPWRGYTYTYPSPTGITAPWGYGTDRQVIYTNWYNITQGYYICANGGTCISPNVCVCAPGWIGFDCRTPVCTQGAYNPQQSTYISGLETPTELSDFLPFMGYNSYRLSWPYSNPNYTVQTESFINATPSNITRQFTTVPGTRYLGPDIILQNGTHIIHEQGGYRCTIRSQTAWENATYLFAHPNYYSRYMNEVQQADGNIYTYWRNLSWPPTYNKTRILDQIFMNITYIYTNEGWRRRGIWVLSGNEWMPGTCLMEFVRTCPADSTKQIDLNSGLNNVKVQDTDLSYRPRILYNDVSIVENGRWDQSTGDCIDYVIRGCNNNGTCIAPDTCQCATGWSGYDCTIPLCTSPCHNNGNCTLPNTCTCERGWSGVDCTVPLCAQECQNGGLCVAPDKCKCIQWPNNFRDGRANGGTPLYQDLQGNPQLTGWTGYDCSTPICVQASDFRVNIKLPAGTNIAAPELNIPIDLIGETDTNLYVYQSLNIPARVPGFYRLGGHGANDLLTCLVNGVIPPRCPQYDYFVTGNEGVSFQTGCGYDPYDTGCCIPDALDTLYVTCYYCLPQDKILTNHTYECAGSLQSIHILTTEMLSPINITLPLYKQFLDVFGHIRICGAYHTPRQHDLTLPFIGQNYGSPQYFQNPDVRYKNDKRYSSQNYLSNYTSNRFLCHVTSWYEGSYDITNVNNRDSYSMNDNDIRTLRSNYVNIVLNIATQQWSHPYDVYGEGVYACANGGSCLGPDYCSCADGYEGFDCSTPLCRHLQPTGVVTSCLHGGVCVSRDTCKCIQVQSILWKVYPDQSRALTGWTGSDCSMPMCSQGYFDPFCTDMEHAPGGEGCYRCANGGNCTAPDACSCAPGWSGYDCRTPVCEVVVDSLMRSQLGTAHEEKVIAFESDPCGVEAIYGLHGFHGRKYTRGNCTMPNQCTCLCKVKYSQKQCKANGKQCSGPWQDPLVKYRNLFTAHGPEYEFGTTACNTGYEGSVDRYGHFTSCHMTIYVPSSLEYNSLILLIVLPIGFAILVIIYCIIRARLKRRYLLAKIERRRNRRAEEPLLASQEQGGGAFYNN